MKFAVDRSLEGRRYETDPIGPSLQRVLRYWTVRNKFEEARIHPDLREIGVTSIRVQEEGLLFERDETVPAESSQIKRAMLQTESSNKKHKPNISKTLLNT